MKFYSWLKNYVKIIEIAIICPWYTNVYYKIDSNAINCMIN